MIVHFKRYHAAEFPALGRVHRTTFARQAANLSAVKRRLHAHLAGRRVGRERVFLVDGVPVDACAFGRAKFAERFRGQAADGHDHTRRNTMSGFRRHVRAKPAGALVDFDLAPANVSDHAMVADIAPPTRVGGRAGPAPA